MDSGRGVVTIENILLSSVFVSINIAQDASLRSEFFADRPHSAMDAFKAALAPHVGDVKVPNMASRVFRECAFSFDTPESADGVYISLHSHSAFGKEFVSLDRERAALAGENIPAVYLRQKWRRVPKAAKAEDAAAPADASADAAGVTKLGLNVPGGYQVAGGDAGWEMDKSDVRLVVFTGAPHEDTHVSIAHPGETRAAGLDGKVLNAIEAILAAADAEAAAAATSAAWEETREVSRFALELQQLNNGVRISPHAADWRCGVPDCDKATSNLWLNLSDGFIGCGRDLGGGKGGNGHALAHFEATGRVFPLCVKLGTITAAGGDVYSYDPSENDMVRQSALRSFSPTPSAFLFCSCHSTTHSTPPPPSASLPAPAPAPLACR